MCAQARFDVGISHVLEQATVCTARRIFDEQVILACWDSYPGGRKLQPADFAKDIARSPGRAVTVDVVAV